MGGCPCPRMLKARLDGALSNLVWWRVSQPIAEGLEIDDPEGVFQPKSFCDYWPPIQ